MKSSIAWRRLAALSLAAALAGSAPAFAEDALDPWITTKVKAALLTADDVRGLDVNVDTTQGRVTLHGKVSSDAEKRRAEELAKNIDGVREVRNLLQVAPGAEREQARASDEQIRERVQARLREQPELADVEIQSVNEGVVLLGGSTKTLSAHLRALEAAREVEGVRRVESSIQSPQQLADEEIWRTPDVGAAPRAARSTASDLWITSAAKVRLLASDVPAMDVNVDTRDGVVTLFGIVGSPEEKKRAADEVAKVEGVQSVRNELQVVPQPRREAAERADEQIADQVRQRLESRVGRGDIDVEVANGVVRLSGTVPSQGERLAALTEARSEEGVRSVVGDLRVERN